MDSFPALERREKIVFSLQLGILASVGSALRVTAWGQALLLQYRIARKAASIKEYEPGSRIVYA